MPTLLVVFQESWYYLSLGERELLVSADFVTPDISLSKNKTLHTTHLRYARKEAATYGVEGGDGGTVAV